MMLTSSCKAKGRTLQKIVRDEILNSFPRLFPDDVRSTTMGSSGEDIQLSAAARRSFPYSVECKSRKTLAFVYNSYKQAKGNNKGEPLLVLKQDRSHPLVVISLSHFMELRKELS